jgi:hypothetical protein
LIALSKDISSLITHPQTIKLPPNSASYTTSNLVIAASAAHLTRLNL